MAALSVDALSGLSEKGPLGSLLGDFVDFFNFDLRAMIEYGRFRTWLVDLRKIISLLLKMFLEILLGESDHVLRGLSDDLLGIGLEDAWKVWVYLDLLSIENAHLADVCHSSYLNLNVSYL